ncbi:MAG: hypothetical protein JW699_06240 [Chitinispirillaceae bacterium]|nr:hypothetical protein [Chitinispirillaceae bacterium]
MNKNAVVLVLLCLAFSSYGQQEMRPWEKYGLSQSEWKLVQENDISMDKVRTLLSAGIAISEYCQQPWKRIGLTEGEWIEKRRAGLTTYDIELEAQSNRRRRFNADTNTAATSGYALLSSGKNQLISLLFPGFQQLRLKQPVRSTIMAGLAIAALAVCAGEAMTQDEFTGMSLYCILAPDMLWSFIDFKISLGKMRTAAP